MTPNGPKVCLNSARRRGYQLEPNMTVYVRTQPNRWASWTVTGCSF